MKALDESDLALIRDDPQFCDKILTKYCFNYGINNEKRYNDDHVSYASPRDTSGRSHTNQDTGTPSGRAVSPHKVLVGRESFASDGPPPTTSDSDTGPQDNPSIDEMIDRLNSLSGALWHSSDMLQKNAADTLYGLSHTLRTINKITTPLNADDLVTSLRDCEMVVESVSRKTHKFRDLMVLDYLQSMLQVNLDAVSLIHNWDDTFRNIRSLFSAYKTFRDNGGNGVKLLQKDSVHEDFNFDKAMELHRILLQLKLSRGLCSSSSPDFNSISATLDSLMIDYAAFIEELVADVVTHYFSPSLDCLELSDDTNDTLGRLCDLAADILGPQEAEVNIIRCVLLRLTKILDVQFSIIWEEHSMAFSLSTDTGLLDEDIVTIEQGLSFIIANFFQMFAKFISDKLALLRELFSTMKSHHLLSDTESTLETMVLNLLGNILRNFDAFVVPLNRLSQPVFLSVVTTALASLECSTEDLVSTMSAFNLREPLLHMCIIPQGLLTRYLSSLDEISQENCWQSLIDADSLEASLSNVDNFVDFVTSLRPNERGILSNGNDVTTCGPFAWVYNRLLLLRLREAYTRLMSRCCEAVTSHFYQLSQREVSNGIGTTTESNCQRILSRMMDAGNKLSEAAVSILLPNCAPVYTESILSAYVARYFQDAERLSTMHAIPQAVIKCLTESLNDVTESIFQDDSDTVNNVATQLVRLISRKASFLMSGYYNSLTTETDSDTDVSSIILMVSEYFTALVPLFSDSSVSTNVLARAFTSFIDEELGRLAAVVTTENLSHRRYHADISQLIIVCNYCNSGVAKSLEQLLDASR
ncbi:two-component system regulatory protein protein, putative [Babesia ovis]|uniref:Two-component system regulatory protein protein, putative n=1 Tax=Babesia ovis TaxID=5869 RepID=A0A9W5WUN4_BABOV|nr:two-component system regulatory protein protein, putative [Babesia ovis]